MNHNIFIYFFVLLHSNFTLKKLYKPNEYNRNATFERKKIDAQIDCEYEHIESVPFNSGNKHYSYCIVNPEPGYIYRLRWEK